VDEGGLARAVLSDDGDDLAAFEVQVDAVDGRALGAGVAEGETPRADDVRAVRRQRQAAAVGAVARGLEEEPRTPS
jgi:hypothetical protein